METRSSKFKRQTQLGFEMQRNECWRHGWSHRGYPYAFFCALLVFFGTE